VAGPFTGFDLASQIDIPDALFLRFWKGGSDAASATFQELNSANIPTPSLCFAKNGASDFIVAQWRSRTIERVGHPAGIQSLTSAAEAAVL